MGLPDVFSINITSFIGIGISFSWHYSEYGKTLDIIVSLPFISADIFCRKVDKNNWFQSRQERRLVK